MCSFSLSLSEQLRAQSKSGNQSELKQQQQTVSKQHAKCAALCAIIIQKLHSQLSCVLCVCVSASVSLCPENDEKRGKVANCAAQSNPALTEQQQQQQRTFHQRTFRRPHTIRSLKTSTATDTANATAAACLVVAPCVSLSLCCCCSHRGSSGALCATPAA